MNQNEVVLDELLKHHEQEKNDAKNRENNQKTAIVLWAVIFSALILSFYHDHGFHDTNLREILMGGLLAFAIGGVPQTFACANEKVKILVFTLCLSSAASAIGLLLFDPPCFNRTIFKATPVTTKQIVSSREVAFCLSFC